MLSTERLLLGDVRAVNRRLFDEGNAVASAAKDMVRDRFEDAGSEDAVVLAAETGAAEMEEGTMVGHDGIVKSE